MTQPPPPGPPPPPGSRPAVPHHRLLAGHVVVLAATVPLAAAMTFHGIISTTPARSSVTGVVLLAIGFTAFATGQGLAIRRLREQRRHLRTGPLPPQALLHGTALLGWSTGLSQMPALMTMFGIAVAPPPPPLLAALGAVTLTALLLDHTHADWTYRQLPHRAPTQLVEPRFAHRVRTGQTTTTGIYVLLALASTALLTLTAISELRRPDPAPLASFVQLLAALSGIALILAAIAPIQRIRSAVTTTPRTGVVHLPQLDIAAHALACIRRLATPVAALGVIAMLADPANPLTAAAHLLVLVLLLTSTTLHHGSLTNISLGTPAPSWPLTRSQPHAF